MKVALVCDWLTHVGGAERVLKAIHDLYPEAPIYTSQYNPKGIDWFLNADVRTGWLQIFPSSLRRFLAPLRQLYFNHLDLSEYDLIISVTGAEAKGIKKGPATHICYCHVPTQYYWQLYDGYVKNPGFGALNPLVRFFFRLLIKPLRRADYRSAQLPDYFVTISQYAQQQIKKYYHRDSTIIHPPVAVKRFSSSKTSPHRQGFIITSRQVNWKRLDLAIKACLKTKQPLTLIGDGSEHSHLQKLAGDSSLITFLPTMTQSELISHLRQAKGYLFPSCEPFGIAPVEALAAGCPVIAYGAGGALDYIQPGINGLLFKHQTVKSLASAIETFLTTQFDERTVAKTATAFSEARFKKQLKEFIHVKTHTR